MEQKQFNHTRVVAIPLRMADGSIENFYLRVANEVPDFILRDMIDEAVYKIRKGMSEWQKIDKEIEKAEKNTWLFVEEKAQ